MKMFPYTWGSSEPPANILVTMIPGVTTLILMPFLASSLAAYRVNCSRAAFDAPYRLIPGLTRTRVAAKEHNYKFKKRIRIKMKEI